MPEGKIKSKDLSYDNSLPPFLQRLHAQNAGRGDQDRHERPVARPKGTKAHDEDDGPTVVDETGETVSKAEFERMTSTDTKKPDTEDDSAESKASGPLEDGVKHCDQKVTDGTATKKRKAAKVVGGEADSEKADEAGVNKESAAKKVVKNAKKKAKPIKLAFDDDGEET